MANTLLDAQTNISNDTLREIVSESAFIGETRFASVYTHATYGTLVAAFSGFPRKRHDFCYRN